MKNSKNRFLQVLILFVTAVSFAQVDNFNAYDLNQDKNIDVDEFSKMYTSSYNDYDLDKNGKMTDREFYGSSFNRLDKDRNGNLNSEEWQRGYDNVYGSYIGSKGFVDFDNDQNQELSPDEYYNSFSNTKYYSTYDVNRDNSLDIKEYRERTYKDWDRNQDGTLDENEYNTYRPFFIDRF